MLRDILLVILPFLMSVAFTLCCVIYINNKIIEGIKILQNENFLNKED